MKPRTVLGVDPGTNLLGYGLLSIDGRTAEALSYGVIDLRRCRDPYEKLGRIYRHISSLAAEFHPAEMAIEAPFFGKNVQSMLKLGRAQGVAIAAGIAAGMEVCEYAPSKIKLSITGNGNASKEQIAGMLQHILRLDREGMPPFMDATDALAAAYCHYLQGGALAKVTKTTSWKEYASKLGVI